MNTVPTSHLHNHNTTRRQSILRSMWIVLAPIILAGCGGGSKPTLDDAGDASIDAEVVTVDCSTYCNRIETNCTGSNAQYHDAAHCATSCQSFTVGTSTAKDMSGNTLGCRIYYAGQPSKDDPAAHCAQAGPAGDSITATPPAFCSGSGSDNDVCTSFCALDIAACGSLEAPLPNDPRDSTGNPIYQYRNMASCIAACDGFDKTHAYSTTAAGDSLACRLYYATNASASVGDAVMNCPSTAATAKGSCAGTPMP